MIDLLNTKQQYTEIIYDIQNKTLAQVNITRKNLAQAFVSLNKNKFNEKERVFAHS